MPGKPKGKEDHSNFVRRDGALALTFVNAGSRRAPRLRNYAELLAWSHLHGGLSAADAHRLETLAAESPAAAIEVFAVAEELHGLLSAIMNSRADDQALPPEALADLNALLPRVAPHRRLVEGATSLQWEWPAGHEDDPRRPLWAIADSVKDLLTSPSYGMVKRCENEGCDVLFLTKGSGGPRRWCNIRICGAPARSRKHYLRVRKPANDAFREKHMAGSRHPEG